MVFAACVWEKVLGQGAISCQISCVFHSLDLGISKHIWEVPTTQTHQQECQHMSLQFLLYKYGDATFRVQEQGEHCPMQVKLVCTNFRRVWIYMDGNFCRRSHMHFARNYTSMWICCCFCILQTVHLAGLWRESHTFINHLPEWANCNPGLQSCAPSTLRPVYQLGASLEMLTLVGRPPFRSFNIESRHIIMACVT